jgi:hypothetical protein
MDPAVPTGPASLAVLADAAARAAREFAAARAALAVREALAASAAAAAQVERPTDGKTVGMRRVLRESRR